MSSLFNLKENYMAKDKNFNLKIENVVSFQKTMQMGLGEAIKRFMYLNQRITKGVASNFEREEYKLIESALNNTKLDLGFDCNNDGVPDSIEIFSKSAQTSCCRIMSTDTSRKQIRTKPPKKVRKKKRG